jgi:hypothetical protein
VWLLVHLPIKRRCAEGSHHYAKISSLIAACLRRPRGDRARF